MARFEQDPTGLVVVLDLHGYKVETAIQVATDKIREAWENGCLEIRLIHGRGVSRLTLRRSQERGRAGTIGQALRDLWERGEWSRWVNDIYVDAGHMRVQLKAGDGLPRRARWSQIPKPEFEHN